MHLNPPFRAEHIGSLKRPQEILDLRLKLDKGAISSEELRAAEDRAIKGVVDMQRRAGIRGITDGEFRRHMFFDGVFDQLEGMTLIPSVPAEMFKLYVPDVKAFQIESNETFKKADSWICTGKLKRVKPLYKDQFEGLKKFVSPEEVKDLKLTVCAPEWFHLRHGEHAFKTDVYSSNEEYFADVVKAYREEFQELYQLGCRNIQFDDPLLAYFCAESMLEGMKKEGTDSEAILDLYIKTYNGILKDRPSDMNIGLHLCRGNFKDGHHFSEGGYDRIAIKLFNDLDFDCYYLEYDTERAGTFEPLKHLPTNKTVVLGLISSKLPKLEDEDYLIKRIHEAADTIANGNPPRSAKEALNQICISPQCGFASHSDGNKISPQEMEEKLKLVNRVAQKIWS